MPECIRVPYRQEECSSYFIMLQKTAAKIIVQPSVHLVSNLQEFACVPGHLPGTLQNAYSFSSLKTNVVFSCGRVFL